MDIESKIKSIELPRVENTIHKEKLWTKIESEFPKSNRLGVFLNLGAKFLLIFLLVPLLYYFYPKNPLQPQITLAEIPDKVEEDSINSINSGKFLHLVFETESTGKPKIIVEKVFKADPYQYEVLVRNADDNSALSYKSVDEEGNTCSCGNCKNGYTWTNYSVFGSFADESGIYIENASIDFLLEEITSYTYASNDNVKYLKRRFEDLKALEGINFSGEETFDGHKVYVIEFNTFINSNTYPGPNEPAKTKIFIDKSTFKIIKTETNSIDQSEGKSFTTSVRYKILEYLEQRPTLDLNGTEIVTEPLDPDGRDLVLRIETPTDKTPGGEGFVSPVSDESCEGVEIGRKWARYHTGIDYTKDEGCWIVAVRDGTVEKARWCEGGLGFCMVIKHDYGYSSLYAHGAGTFNVKERDEVKAGDRIMYMGNTGNSLNTHLHFSLAENGDDVLIYNARINPMDIIPL